MYVAGILDLSEVTISNYSSLSDIHNTIYVTHIDTSKDTTNKNAVRVRVSDGVLYSDTNDTIPADRVNSPCCNTVEDASNGMYTMFGLPLGVYLLVGGSISWDHFGPASEDGHQLVVSMIKHDGEDIKYHFKMTDGETTMFESVDHVEGKNGKTSQYYHMYPNGTDKINSTGWGGAWGMRKIPEMTDIDEETTINEVKIGKYTMTFSKFNKGDEPVGYFEDADGNKSYFSTLTSARCAKSDAKGANVHIINLKEATWALDECYDEESVTVSSDLSQCDFKDIIIHEASTLVLDTDAKLKYSGVMKMLKSDSIQFVNTKDACKTETEKVKGILKIKGDNVVINGEVVLSNDGTVEFNSTGTPKATITKLTVDNTTVNFNPSKAGTIEVNTLDIPNSKTLTMTKGTLKLLNDTTLNGMLVIASGNTSGLALKDTNTTLTVATSGILTVNADNNITGNITLTDNDGLVVHADATLTLNKLTIAVTTTVNGKVVVSSIEGAVTSTKTFTASAGLTVGNGSETTDPYPASS